MAKVTIPINSEVEEEGAPLRDVLQRIAEAHEGHCGNILGDPDKMKKYYQKILHETPHLLSIIIKMGNDVEKIYNASSNP